MTIDLKSEGYPFTMHFDDMRRLLNCGRNALYLRIKNGEVPRFVRPGRRYEWRRPDVELWLENPGRLRRAQ